jgi:two-component system, NtrC family, C4-dicarboxylate transport sensor histidine kinase DctB
VQELLTSERLQELRHFAELGRMSAVLLHEISHPLTAALLNLEASDHKSVAVRRARRDIQLMKHYVEAARLQVCRQSKVTIFCVQPQLDQLKRVITPLARKAGVELDITPLPGCRLRGDPVKFQHIITNLVVNALDAYGEVAVYKRPAIKVTPVHVDGWLTIEVKDRAMGIATEALPKLFDEFYTTKTAAGQGLGIGLAIVKQYVTADFRGSVMVASSRRGTRFTVKLPALAA